MVQHGSSKDKLHQIYPLFLDRVTVLSDERKTVSQIDAGENCG